MGIGWPVRGMKVMKCERVVSNNRLAWLPSMSDSENWEIEFD